MPYPPLSDDLLLRFDHARDVIKKSTQILLVSPSLPDIDSISSCLLLKEYLELPWVLKPYTLFCKTPLPSVEENPLFAFFRETVKFTPALPESPADCVIILDYSHFDTTRLDPNLFPRSCVFIGFDHHANPAPDFPENGFQIVDPKAASTTLLLYHFFRFVGVPVSSIMATYVALGIYTDTARLTQFKNKNTADALRVFADCVEGHSIPWDEMQKRATPQVSKKRTEVWQKCMGTWRLEKDVGLLSLTVSRSLCRYWDAEPKDIKTCMGMMQNMSEAQVAAIILEVENNFWNVILRTRDPERFPVSEIAERIGGGGHMHAAGATVRNPEKALYVIRQSLKEMRGLTKIGG